MTQIKFSEWGASVNSTYTSWAMNAMVPAFPACAHWEGTSGAEYHKYKIRMFGDVPDPATVLSTNLCIKSGPYVYDYDTVAATELQTTTTAWNTTFSAALKADTYPGPAHKVSKLKNANRCMPFHMLAFGIYWVSDGTGAEDVVVYGFEIGVEHGQAYDGSDMELFDYDDGSYTTDYPASSAFVSLAGIAAYNDILYHGCWRFSVAIAGTRT